MGVCAENDSMAGMDNGNGGSGVSGGTKDTTSLNVQDNQTRAQGTTQPQAAAPQAAQVSQVAQASQPAQTAPAGQPKNGKPDANAAQSRGGRGMLPLIAAMVIVIAAGGAYYFFVVHRAAVLPNVTVSTTTVPQIQVSKISSCRVINASGTYYISQNIGTSINSGACIDIRTSNVKLIGNGNNITGSGPYVATPPYTYGILVENATNVTVTGIGVSKFSYDIYLTGSVRSTISNSRVQNGTISGIYLLGSYHNTIENNSVTGVASKGGGIALQVGGNNTVLNNIIQHNAYYGAVINSSGNTFAADTFLNNPIDTVCVGENGKSSANRFEGSQCSVNNYCNFASCSASNTPFNLSTIRLSNKIYSCGWIDAPGTYTMENNLSLDGYVNFSLPYSKGIACLTINSSNVQIDCRNGSVYNVGQGIAVGNPDASTYNISISNCNFRNYATAINTTRVFDINVSRVTAYGGTAGLYFNNDTAGSVSDTAVGNNTYGAYVNDTQGVSFSGLVAKGNEYGTYVNGAQGNAYYGSTFANNTNTDLACSAQSYRSTFNIFSGDSCGVTDCKWGASCTTYKEPQLSQYMMAGCGNITASGNYSLSAGPVASGSCIYIKASNVNLNCSSFNITGSMKGTAITVQSGTSNVNIADCNINDFARGVYAMGSSRLSINNVTIGYTNAPVVMNNVSYSSLSNVHASRFTAGGFRLLGFANSTLTNSSASFGLNGSAGFMLNGSSNNLLLYDSAVRNAGYGFAFSGSLHNTVANNTATGNAGSDFYCAKDSSGMYAEKGGINNGFNKTGCVWLVEIPPSELQASCAAINTASHITFTHDMLYPYGQACYTIYSNSMGSGNNTVINCNGHTVYASKGGSFVRVVNSSGIKVENCYLKGFTTPIVATGISDKIINNTIGMANVSVSVYGAQYPDISNNRFNNASYGVMAENSKYGTVDNNNFADVNISAEIAGSEQFYVANNTAMGKSTIGLYLVNSYSNSVGNNNFNASSKAGLACTLGSENQSSLNQDIGGNVCNGRLNCNWISKSTMCKA